MSRSQSAFDVVIIGGGFAGSSLATVLSRVGFEVALVERTRQFEDRVRGEALAPWGVAEAKRLGLFDALVDRAEARQLPFWSTYSAGCLHIKALADLDPHGEGVLSFRHQVAQSALWSLARDSGVTTFRPARIDGLHHSRGMATVRVDGALLKTPLVVGADGRASAVRRALGNRYVGDEPTHTVSGLLVTGARVDPTSVLTGRVRHGRLLVFPIDERHTRVYYMADPSQTWRLRGKRAGEEIISVCRSELTPTWFTQAMPAGPPATFQNADRWVPHPWSRTMALIGDAAGTGDPSIGQGLSVTLRDVRELSRGLVELIAWRDACARYARNRLRYFHTQRMIARWTWELDEPGSEGARLRHGTTRAQASADRSELMWRIRLDPARVAMGKRLRNVILFGNEQAESIPGRTYRPPSAIAG